MTNPIPPRSIKTRALVLDVVVILALSTLAEVVHFSVRNGRHVICADSVQYMDNAQALVDGDRTPHFEFRKPGYSLWLAGLLLIADRLGWTVVLAQYVLQIILPLAAYGLGKNLHSRLAGRLAAILLMVRHQFEYRTERIMSEVLYTFLLTLGLWLLTVVMAHHRRFITLTVFISGVMLAMAWLTRSIAVAPIAAGTLCIIVFGLTRPMQTIVRVLCLLLPVIGAYLFESSLNLKHSGVFRPGTGTLGPTLLIRARAFMGVPFSDSEAAKQCLSLLAERSPEDAYLVNKLDGWVAWHRAIHRQGMDDWQVDALMKRAALEMIRDNPLIYLRTSLSVFTRVLLRQDAPPTLSRVPVERLKPILLPDGVEDSAEHREGWYVFWSLPHRTPERARALVANLHEQADQRAPVGGQQAWARLRYYWHSPPVADVLRLLESVAKLWPGLALLGCCRLGLDRRICLLIALAYIFDAAIIGATAFSDSDIKRFQYVWLTTDTTLAAALVAGVIDKLRAVRVLSEQMRDGS